MRRDIPNNVVVILVVGVLLISIVGAIIFSENLEAYELEVKEVLEARQQAQAAEEADPEAGNMAGNIGLNKIQ